MKYIEFETDCLNPILLGFKATKQQKNKIHKLIFHIKENNNFKMYPVSGSFIKLKNGYGICVYTMHCAIPTVFECTMVKNKIEIIQNDLNVNINWFGELWKL